MFCLSIHRSRCLAVYLYLCVFVRPIFVPQFSPNGTLYSVAQTHCISSSQSFQLTKVGRQVGTQQVGRQVGRYIVGRQVGTQQVGRQVHSVAQTHCISSSQSFQLTKVGRQVHSHRQKRHTFTHTNTHDFLCPSRTLKQYLNKKQTFKHLQFLSISLAHTLLLSVSLSDSNQCDQML